MSNLEPQPEKTSQRWRIALVLGVVLASVAGAVAYLAMSSTTGKRGGSGTGKETAEDPLKAGQAALARDTDVNACRNALQEFNVHLARPGSPRPSPLTDEERGRLQKLFALDKDELAEVESPTFTTLDGRYLEECYLLRDAVRVFDPGEVQVPGQTSPLTPLDRAAAAFAWVVRQVRLEAPSRARLLYLKGASDPPAFVLRRGSGTPLERAFTFLALLRQLGAPGEFQGCLVLLPNSEGGPSLWACGVLAGNSTDTYLFDPGLGLPLPGKDGKGVATLSQVRKDPSLLDQLQGDGKRYEVTAEKVKTAEVYQVCPLSALAPRMRLLSKDLLGTAAHLFPAADGPAENDRLSAAFQAAGGKDGPVPVWKEGTGLLRRFLPSEEGGSDRQFPFNPGDLPGYSPREEAVRVPMGLTRMILYGFELVPWTALPEECRSLPPNLDLGQRVRGFFSRPFTESALGTGTGRDLVLRGRFSKVAPDLVQERDRLKEQRGRRETYPNLEEKLAAWSKEAIQDYADLLRAKGGNNPQALRDAEKRVEELWKHAEPLIVQLQGAIAGPRGAEVTYLLGQCQHERAEALHARLDVLQRIPGRTIPESEKEKARDAWKDALTWWRRYAEEYPNGPSAAAARRMRGRAELMLGDWKAAVASWEDLSGSMSDSEKLACLYLARQVKQQHADAKTP
jgi:hypothetical protein